MKKIILLTLIYVFITNHSYSQRVFNSLGFSLETASSYEPYTDVLGFALKYQLRYNILEFGEENSLSINYTPALGGFFGSIYFASPIILKYDFGANSTYYSIRKRGVALGFGYQGILQHFNDDFYSGNNFSYQPVALVSYTKYNKKKERAFDTNITLNPLMFIEEITYESSKQLSISFNYYIKYKRRYSKNIKENKILEINNLITEHVRTNEPNKGNYGAPRRNYKMSVYSIKTYSIGVMYSGNSNAHINIDDYKKWKAKFGNNYNIYSMTPTTNTNEIYYLTFMPNKELAYQEKIIDSKIAILYAEDKKKKKKKKEDKLRRDSIRNAPLLKIYNETCTQKIEYAKQNTPFYTIKEYDKGLYIGEYIAGKRSGSGMFIKKIRLNQYWSKKCEIYEGSWEDDKQNGRGIYSYPGVEFMRGVCYYEYHGSFKNGKQHGVGSVYRNGRLVIENGRFENGYQKTIPREKSSFDIAYEIAEKGNYTRKFIETHNNQREYEITFSDGKHGSIYYNFEKEKWACGGAWLTYKNTEKEVIIELYLLLH